MKPKARIILVGAIIGIVIASIIGWQVARLLEPREFELQRATVVEIDPTARTARIEFIHPKSGRTMTASGSIPPDCPITIDGEPATLEDVRVGDVGALKATSRGLQVEANWVRITRSADEQAAPATVPTTQPSS